MDNPVNFQEFIDTVREMRTFQKEYFKTMGMAKKPGNRHLYATAKEYLDTVKPLERKVDAILNQKHLKGKEANND